MNDQDHSLSLSDPDRPVEGLSHFLTNLLRNLASCQTSLRIFRRRFFIRTNKKIYRVQFEKTKLAIVCQKIDVEKNIEWDNNEVFFELFHLMCHLFKTDKE
jgi:hypothetical protein